MKPHASPVYHAIKYLTGELDRSYLTRLRDLGGLQAYPSRTKDPDVADFSTGSVGLGVVAPLFAAATRRYVDAHFGHPRRATGSIHRARRRRRTRRGQHLGGDRRPGVAGSRQRDVGRRHQPPESRPRRARSEDQEADGVLRRRGMARRRSEVRRSPPGRVRPARRRDLREFIDAMSNEEYQSLFALRGDELRERLLAGADRVGARRRSAATATTSSHHWCRTSAATTSAR